MSMATFWHRGGRNASAARTPRVAPPHAEGANAIPPRSSRLSRRYLSSGETGPGQRRADVDKGCGRDGDSTRPRPGRCRWPSASPILGFRCCGRNDILQTRCRRDHFRLFLLRLLFIPPLVHAFCHNRGPPRPMLHRMWRIRIFPGLQPPSRRMFRREPDQTRCGMTGPYLSQPHVSGTSWTRTVPEATHLCDARTRAGIDSGTTPRERVGTAMAATYG